MISKIMKAVRLAMYKRKLKRIKIKGEQHKREKAVMDAYAEYWPDRKKRKVSNIMLVVIITAIVSYTVAAFWVQYKTGIPMDSTLSTFYRVTHLLTFKELNIFSFRINKISRNQHKIFKVY